MIWVAVALTVSLSSSRDPGDTVTTIGICDPFINGRSAGDALIAFDGPDVWIPARLLRDAGVDWTEGREQTLRGEVLVAVGSLVPKMTVRVDDREAAVYVTVPPDGFVAVTNLAPAPAIAPPPARAPNVFMNY